MQPSGRFFEVRELLGTGAFGVVYRARLHSAGGLQRDVAIKFLRDPAPDATRRLQREGRLLAQLSHPAILDAYDVVTLDGRLALVMEYVPGVDLAGMFSGRSSLPPQALVEVVGIVADALHAASRPVDTDPTEPLRLVHRDIKPSNIRVSVYGAVKLLDFGVAWSEAETSTLGDSFTGSIPYMAPERLLMARADPSGDVYSLGCVLYEGIAGQRLHPGCGVPEALAHLSRLSRSPELHDEYVDQALAALRTPEVLVQLMREMLLADPEARATTAAVAASCERIAPQLEGPTFRSWCKEHDWIIPGPSTGDLSGRLLTEDPSDGAGATMASHRGPRSVAHHLPAERDGFVGRSRELALLARAVAEGPLVTVQGTGGCGKTRLALHFGRTTLGRWPGGVWFCDLAEVQDLAGIERSVARTLGGVLGQGDPIDQIGRSIAARGQCLVILDNVEQVAQSAAEALTRWLDLAPGARFVVTSRTPIGLAGEIPLLLDVLAPGDGYELFVIRAHQASPSFEPTETGRAIIEALVAQVDALPLAIELAAARARVLSPKTILARMGERFRILSTAGGGTDRQATLRATLDWSWELLTTDEQTALAQLSTFEGTFSLLAAEAVLELSRCWVPDVLQELVDKSLVRSLGGERFDLLLSVRSYAAEPLASSEGTRSVELRHGRYYASLCPERDDEWDTEGAWARELDLDNLLAACRRACDRGDGEVAARTFLAVWSVLALRGPYAVGADLARRVLAQDMPPSLRARASRAAGRALGRLGRPDEGRVLLQQALALARESGERSLEGLLLDNLGDFDFVQGQFDGARDYYAAARDVVREVGERGFEGAVLAHLGLVEQMLGNLDTSRAYFDDALSILREVGSRGLEGAVLGYLASLHYTQGRLEDALQSGSNALSVMREVGLRTRESEVHGALGNARWAQGRMDEASEHYAAARDIAAELGDRRNEGLWTGNLGVVAAARQRPEEAENHYALALAISRELGDRSGEGFWLANLGAINHLLRRPIEARAYYRAALVLQREVGARLHEAIASYNLGMLDLEEGRLDDADENFARAEPSLRESESRVELARFLCCRARLHAARTDGEAARADIAEVQDLVAELGLGPDSEPTRDLSLAKAEVASRLGVVSLPADPDR